MRKIVKTALLSTSIFTFALTGLGGHASAETLPTNYFYSVQSGDTLNLIAQKHGIGLSDLLWYNTVKDPDSIFIGQRFFVPAPWLITADKVMVEGKKYYGATYEYGAPSGQTNSFDCSSFTQHIYGTQGINLPRDSRDQSLVGDYISRDQLQKGDLVFFSTDDRKYLDGINRIGHVAMYIGNDKLLHTFNESGVKITSFEGNSYWKSHYITTRRVIE